jgi:hypothetical protein
MLQAPTERFKDGIFKDDDSRVVCCTGGPLPAPDPELITSCHVGHESMLLQQCLLLEQLCPEADVLMLRTGQRSLKGLDSGALQVRRTNKGRTNDLSAQYRS